MLLTPLNLIDSEWVPKAVRLDLAKRFKDVILYLRIWIYNVNSDVTLMIISDKYSDLTE